MRKSDPTPIAKVWGGGGEEKEGGLPWGPPDQDGLLTFTAAALLDPRSRAALAALAVRLAQARSYPSGGIGRDGAAAAGAAYPAESPPGSDPGRPGGCDRPARGLRVAPAGAVVLGSRAAAALARLLRAWAASGPGGPAPAAGGGEGALGPLEAVSLEGQRLAAGRAGRLAAALRPGRAWLRRLALPGSRIGPAGARALARALGGGGGGGGGSFSEGVSQGGGAEDGGESGSDEDGADGDGGQLGAGGEDAAGRGGGWEGTGEGEGEDGGGFGSGSGPTGAGGSAGGHGGPLALEELDLTGNGIGPAGLAALADALRPRRPPCRPGPDGGGGGGTPPRAAGAAGLRALRLGGNRLGAGAGAGLWAAPALAELDLADNGVDGAAAAAALAGATRAWLTIRGKPGVNRVQIRYGPGGQRRSRRRRRFRRSPVRCCGRRVPDLYPGANQV
jgi:hypothetical protein